MTWSQYWSEWRGKGLPMEMCWIQWMYESGHWNLETRNIHLNNAYIKYGW